MKLLIASDIHGSAYWCRKLITAIDAEAPDAVLLLGDLLYHGPRNDLPREYAPKQVIPLLNGLADRVVAVRGNCDSEVDQMVLDFPCMADYALVADGTFRMFCTHGHLFRPDEPDTMPKFKGDAFLYGHTHVKRNEVLDGVRLFNPGSVSIPKDGSHSFGVYQDGVFEHRLL